MKNINSFSGLMVLVLSAALIAPGCSKDNNTQPPTPDYTSLFTNSSWTGIYTDPIYPNVESIYSLEFTSNSNVILHTIQGDSTGVFTLLEDKLTLSLRNATIQISAVVTSDHHLTQFSNLISQSWQMKTGVLNTIPTNQPLEGRWKGSFTNAGSLTLDFQSGNAVSFDGGLYNYTRTAGGVVVFEWINIRWTRMFMVITSDNTLSGNYINGFGNYNSFTATKQ